jgi:hypothetical protein
MSEHRQRMDAALKARFVPALRERGFAGSLPNLRRRLPERVDYLNVQYLSSGGSFTLNLGRTGPDGLVAGPSKDLPVDRITANHVFGDRRRVTPRDAGSHAHGVAADFWEFAPRSYDDDGQAPRPQAHYDAVADRALDTSCASASPGSRAPIRPSAATRRRRRPAAASPATRCRSRACAGTCASGARRCGSESSSAAPSRRSGAASTGRRSCR